MTAVGRYAATSQDAGGLQSGQLLPGRVQRASLAHLVDVGQRRSGQLRPPDLAGAGPVADAVVAHGVGPAAPDDRGHRHARGVGAHDRQPLAPVADEVTGGEVGAGVVRGAPVPDLGLAYRAPVGQLRVAPRYVGIGTRRGWQVRGEGSGPPVVVITSWVGCAGVSG
jgi:hypothetical protein